MPRPHTRHHVADAPRSLEEPGRRRVPAANGRAATGRGERKARERGIAFAEFEPRPLPVSGGVQTLRSAQQAIAIVCARAEARLWLEEPHEVSSPFSAELSFVLSGRQKETPQAAQSPYFVLVPKRTRISCVRTRANCY